MAPAPCGDVLTAALLRGITENHRMSAIPQALPPSFSSTDFRAALGTFSAGVANLAPAAYQFQGYKFNRAIMLPTVTRVTQAIVGEMSTDEAVSKIAADMADAVKQAQK